MIYVRIKPLITRRDQLALGVWLNQSGVKEVEYSRGGWADRLIKNASPHLRFKNYEDAIAYVLAHGGEISKTIPEVREDSKEFWQL